MTGSGHLFFRFFFCTKNAKGNKPPFWRRAIHTDTSTQMQAVVRQWPHRCQWSPPCPQCSSHASGRQPPLLPNDRQAPGRSCKTEFPPPRCHDDPPFLVTPAHNPTQKPKNATNRGGGFFFSVKDCFTCLSLLSYSFFKLLSLHLRSFYAGMWHPNPLSHRGRRGSICHSCLLLSRWLLQTHPLVCRQLLIEPIAPTSPLPSPTADALSSCLSHSFKVLLRWDPGQKMKYVEATTSPTTSKAKCICTKRYLPCLRPMNAHMQMPSNNVPPNHRKTTEKTHSDSTQTRPYLHMKDTQQRSATQHRVHACTDMHMRICTGEAIIVTGMGGSCPHMPGTR